MGGGTLRRCCTSFKALNTNLKVLDVNSLAAGVNHTREFWGNDVEVEGEVEVVSNCYNQTPDTKKPSSSRVLMKLTSSI